MTATEAFIILAALVGIALLKYGGGAPWAMGPAGTVPASADDPDHWATPYYLRYNVPLGDSGAYMPTGSSYTYALGSPISPQLGGRVLQIGE